MKIRDEWGTATGSVGRAAKGALLGVLCLGLVCGAHAAAPEGLVRDLKAPDPAVRAQAAVWLGRTGDRAAGPALAEALRDPEKDVRREAAKALGLLKDERAAEALAQALKDADANVRFYAAYALGEIKDPKMSAPLLAALGDPEWCVRNQAAWSLRELHDPSIGAAVAALLKESGADAATLGWLLKQLGGASAVSPLAALLKDADPEIRLRAARALAEIREPASVDPLIGAHWSFDDGNAAAARDVTGNGNDGRIAGGKTAEGRVGAALALDGTGGVELGRPKELPTADQPITVMAWVQARGPNGVVVARGGAFTGYSLYVKDGLPKFGMRRTAQDAAAAIVSGARPITGEWTHLAATIKQECIELYVNGKLEASAKTGGCLPGNCGQGMEIGFDAGSSAVEITDHFAGRIDEVKVYQQALDADAIAAEAHTGGKP